MDVKNDIISRQLSMSKLASSVEKMEGSLAIVA
jgi:hypothetical protein